MKVRIKCPNLRLYQITTCHLRERCAYSFESDSERLDDKCPCCGQLVNVKKLVEERKYELIR